MCERNLGVGHSVARLYENHPSSSGSKRKGPGKLSYSTLSEIFARSCNGALQNNQNNKKKTLMLSNTPLKLF